MIAAQDHDQPLDALYVESLIIDQRIRPAYLTAPGVSTCREGRFLAGPVLKAVKPSAIRFFMASTVPECP